MGPQRRAARVAEELRKFAEACGKQKAKFRTAYSSSYLRLPTQRRFCWHSFFPATSRRCSRAGIRSSSPPGPVRLCFSRCHAGLASCNGHLACRFTRRPTQREHHDSKYWMAETTILTDAEKEAEA